MKTKRVLAGLIAAAMLLTISASAATDDGVFTRTSNRQPYTPNSCIVSVQSTRVTFYNMRWDDGYMFGGAIYWEGELRGTGGYNISDAYSDAVSVTGTLPYLYYEYDEDDVSVGCKGMSDIDPDVTYSGIIDTVEGPNYDDGVELLVESETGIYLFLDGIPQNYQVYEDHINTVTNRMVSW